MDQPTGQFAPHDVAATLRRVYAFIFAQFGNLGVEPARQGATCNWISAIFRKIETHLARYQAGRLRRVTTPRAPVQGRKIVNKPAFRVSRKWGWLLATGRHHAAYHGLQIRMVLELPDMVALLDASPQAQRIMRPLCRAFGVEMPWAVDRPPAPRKRRIRKPRPVFPEDARIRWQRGEKTWIRKNKQMERLIKLKHELVAKMAKDQHR